jgi:hypothetical protein
VILIASSQLIILHLFKAIAPFLSTPQPISCCFAYRLNFLPKVYHKDFYPSLFAIIHTVLLPENYTPTSDIHTPYIQLCYNLL